MEKTDGEEDTLSCKFMRATSLSRCLYAELGGIRHIKMNECVLSRGDSICKGSDMGKNFAYLRS